MNRIERITEIIESVRNFRFCGPGDDPDEQTAVTVGYRYLLVELQRLAAPLLSEPKKKLMASLSVEFNDIFSVYEADAELRVLLYDIEEALDRSDDSSLISVSNTLYMIDTAVIERLSTVQSERFGTEFLVRLCKEINSSFSHDNIVATALTMRTVLNHVPPVFGYNRFQEVAAHSERSDKDSFTHLEDGLRKIADSLAHRTISNTSLYPSAAQVEPYKPQFEMLLNKVYDRLVGDDGNK